MPQISLLAGDIDNNGVIDQFDAMTIGMSYNTATPAAADLNNDGTINVLDLELLAGNYRKVGRDCLAINIFHSSLQGRTESSAPLSPEIPMKPVTAFILAIILTFTAVFKVSAQSAETIWLDCQYHGI